MRSWRLAVVLLGFGLVVACGWRPSGQPREGSAATQSAAAATPTTPAASPVASPTAAAVSAAPAQGGAATEAITPFNRAEFEAFLTEVRSEALQKGIKPDVVRTALTGVEPIMRIIERDRNQAEFKLSFATYRDRVITPANVQRGQKLRDDNQALLRQVSQRYGVQPRFVLAIWGIETRYGAVKADVPLVHSLATLAFDRRRSSYFRNELFAALTMLDRGFIDFPTMKGSWAGAMGQPQFMPTSYLAYAEDFDGDGKRDIWTNTGDVFASIGNYLGKHGWNTAQTWGREVRISADLQKRLGEFAREGRSGCRAIDQMTRDMSLEDWSRLGVRRADGGELPKVQQSGALVQPDGAGGPTFLVYGNYRSILRYNCAHHYALTVSLLADRLGDG
ncbi:MAG: lytic murein transglycosylase [Ferrovibrio sp.]|uniref:lytic murein transglycosylase n=1 Tax=Ferrovibrio sp. TaxID=1917215 RepID=UPI002614C52C|nr:lytic murein transglycosylase [Ferrovibrio sp.]MCW0235321.1 lytic murein transglycosylase [Ferrovibrio sp.]